MGQLRVAADAHLTERNETGLLSEQSRRTLMTEGRAIGRRGAAAASCSRSRRPTSCCGGCSTRCGASTADGRDVRFLFIRRHPLAVALAQRSYLDASHLRWPARRAGSTSEPRATSTSGRTRRRARRLRYEDLAADPAGTLATIFEWLGVDDGAAAARASAVAVLRRALPRRKESKEARRLLQGARARRLRRAGARAESGRRRLQPPVEEHAEYSVHSTSTVCVQIIRPSTRTATGRRPTRGSEGGPTSSRDDARKAETSAVLRAHGDEPKHSRQRERRSVLLQQPDHELPRRRRHEALPDNIEADAERGRGAGDERSVGRGLGRGGGRGRRRRLLRQLLALRGFAIAAGWDSRRQI